MEIVYISGSIGIIYYLWLAILATIAVRYDRTLDTFQKNAQTIFVWLVPIFGSAIVLNLVWEHYPDAIPKSWIPWPFKKLIYGKSPPGNKNRDNNMGPGSDGNYSRHNNSDIDSGGDGGGGGGD